MNLLSQIKNKLCNAGIHHWGATYLTEGIQDEQRICAWCGEIEVLAPNPGAFAEGFHWEKLAYYKHKKEMGCKDGFHHYSLHPRTGRYTCLICGKAKE